MKQYKRPLHVAVDVDEPSVVELTVRETVRLDRIRTTDQGQVAEQHGELLRAGTQRLELGPGRFMLKTMTDTDLRIVHGGVRTATFSGKDPWPPPPPPLIGEVIDSDELEPGDTPILTVWGD